MEREPTPADRVLAGFMGAVCSIAVFGILTFGIAVGLTQFHAKLGVAYFALCLCILVFQNHFARRPWSKALANYVARAFERAIATKR